MDNPGITDILEEIAVSLELKGENPSRRAPIRMRLVCSIPARAILRNWWRKIGSGNCRESARRCTKKSPSWSRRGRLDYYEKLRASSSSTLAMMDIPALGPKKIKAVHEKLWHLQRSKNSEAACQAHKCAELAGFGAKTEEKILANIAQSRTTRSSPAMARLGRRRRKFAKALRDHEAVIQAGRGGQFAAGPGEIVKDLDFVASSRLP